MKAIGKGRWLFVAWLSVSAVAWGLAQPPPREAGELVELAEKAEKRGDREEAWRLVDAALQMDPQNPYAHYERGLLLMLVIDSVEGEAQEAVRSMAKRDLEFVIQNLPGSSRASLAQDMLARDSGKDLFPDNILELCSEEANAAYLEAERGFASGRLKQSMESYRQATRLCPQNAFFWIHYGDAYFSLKDFEQASSLYSEGLRADPWNRSGHRFLADARMRLGNFAIGRRECALAVLSDPLYEAGWSCLEHVTREGSGEWKRVRVEKPRVHRRSILLLEGGLERQPAESRCWRIYAQAKERLLSRRRIPGALETERLSVERALSAYRTMRGQGAKSGFWELMLEAKAAGSLDEAIFVHLLDEDLLPDYKKYRDSNKERLVRYLEEVAAPMPGSGD